MPYSQSLVDKIWTKLHPAFSARYILLVLSFKYQEVNLNDTISDRVAENKINFLFILDLKINIK